MARVPVFIISFLFIQCGWAKSTNEVSPRAPVPEIPEISRAIERSNFRNGSLLSCSAKEAGGPKITGRNGVIDTKYRWKDFIIYVDPSYSQDDYNLINNALYGLSQAAPRCVNYLIYPRNTPKPSSGDFVHVRKSQGCTAAVGKGGGAQWMSLESPGCMHIGVIQHEMIHSLGFYHEQSRQDRDDYVTIYWENIQSGLEFAFEKASGTTTFNVPYNTKSIMQYYSYSFSKNGKPTIVAKNGKEIPYNYDLQQTDIDKIKKMYNC